MMKRVLVVCTGNVCRSPAAQALLERALPGRTIESAGIAATSGTAIDPVMNELLIARGLDVSAHRSQRVDERVCRSADVILVMELAHRHLIERAYPMVRGRVYRLAERYRADVPDPYRRSRHVYDYAMTLIEHGATDWAARIANLDTSRAGHPGSGADRPQNTQ